MRRSSRADAFLKGLGGTKNYLEGPARDIRTAVYTSRGDVAAAEAEARLLLDHAREVIGEQVAPALADAARAFHAAGHRDEADELLTELLRDSADDLGSAWLRELPLFLVELGRADDYLTASESRQSVPVARRGPGGRARRARRGRRPVCGDRRARDGGVGAVARGGEVRRRGTGRARTRVLRVGARDAVRAALRGFARLVGSGGVGRHRTERLDLVAARIGAVPQVRPQLRFATRRQLAYDGSTRAHRHFDRAHERVRWRWKSLREGGRPSAPRLRSRRSASALPGTPSPQGRASGSRAATATSHAPILAMTVRDMAGV